ncbi:MAG: 30S ribosomal protein S11 [Candidatus Kerfeldbacteria bacterium CG_4_10_14_0_8_um_filter_42_10]|uniref:Small ribosomal subunit protein uS11 n=1 Tax=Candidatus Kerfeldbacteria bacterium CG_4_10_14_0_8_um_filter_42_10 TaxID=2014248 RepID=A0A2M7RIG7_9BACT|nr:MAG: 30S ribosomal protein S11 [Candidatus Kerfeldbacteria bacterium CG_4_10_14_0_8_um_filter_42_10]
MEKEKSLPRKRKKRKIITHGAVHIQATYNNTIVTIADPNGNVIAWSSAGISGFKGPKKSTPFAAGIIVRNLLEKIKDVGLREVDVFIKGVGSGREAAIRALGSAGLNILSIKDVTPIPHNGPRPPKPRRV